MRRRITSDDRISLAVVWPQGRSLLIKVDPKDPVKAALDVVYEGSNCQYYPFVLHKGRLLQLALSFSFQGVKNGDELIIYEHAAMRPAPDVEPHSFDANVFSVMVEAMLIHDKAYRHIEGNSRAGLLFQTLHDARQESEWITQEPLETVVPQKAEEVSTAPLPMLVATDDEPDDDYESYEVPSFETIEEAGKFFSKHPFSQWSW